MIEAVRKLVEYVFGKTVGAETIRYIFVGGLTTLVNFGLFTLLTRIFHIEVTASNLFSISVSIIFAYITNKLIVFRHQSSSFAGLSLEFLKFVGSRLFTMALEVGIVHVFFYTFGYDALLGKVLANVLVVIANYIISKLVVFRANPE